MTARESDHPGNQQPGWLTKLLILAGIAVLAALAYWQFGDMLSLEYLASREAEFRSWQANYPVVVALVAVVIYVIVTGVSLPGAAAMSLFCGWYFGFWQALVIVSFGSTGGAMVAFLLSRFLLGDWVQKKMAERFQSINETFNREGPFYLFTLRLVPVVPFFVINVVMGLTKIRARTFWWVSQLGMLPGTAAYVYAGYSVPSLQTLADEGPGKILNWQLLLAFVIIGLLPLLTKRVLRFVQHQRTGTDSVLPVEEA